MVNPIVNGYVVNMTSTRTMLETAAAVAAVLIALPAYDSCAETSTRPLSTDRPDRTESPYTVPLHSFQLEVDLLSFGRFDSGGTRIEGLAIAPFNLKYGLTDVVDVRLLYTPVVHTKFITAGNAGRIQAESVDDGSGPAGMRFKINLAGNDDGNLAIAVLPYFLAPTRGAEKLDNTLYGVLVPVTLPLDGDRAVGAMAGAEKLGNSDTFAIASLTFSTPIASGWGGFVEWFSTMNGFGDDDSQIVTLDAGVIYAPQDHWALDAGIYYGLTSDAEDWRVFGGFSVRR